MGNGLSVSNVGVLSASGGSTTQLNKILVSVGPAGSVQYWIVNYDGSNATQVNIPALPTGFSAYNGSAPSLSPDGTKILFFVVQPSNSNYGAIYSCNINGTNLVKVFERNLSYNNWQFGGAY